MNTVLVVDDDQTLTIAIAARLQSAGFHVCISNNADDASRTAIRMKPAVILLDIDMPHYTGLEFHDCLKFADRGRSVPVIYLSGHDSDLNRRAAMEQGAAAFLTKPYDPVQLIETIRATIARTSDVI